MARPLAPFSTYPVSDGAVFNHGHYMGQLDDYLGGVNDPQRAKDLRAQSRAEGKYAPGPGAGGKEIDKEPRKDKKGW